MANIFEYTDFRDYLRDQFSDFKRADPKFSHRYLAQKLGLASPNFILLIMQGKRNLTPSLAFKLSKFLKHSAQESDYLIHLVGFLQAKTGDEKNAHFVAMIQARKELKIERIEERQYQYYSNWFNPVIRELVTRESFDADFKSIAQSLMPPITAAQARQSIELLVRLDMIRKEGSRYVQSNPIISTGPEINSLAVMNFHKTMARLAAESYDRHLRAERSITSCTVCMSHFAFESLKKDIADLRAKALKLAETQNDDVRVYQLNVQLFPVSRSLQRSGAHEKA